MTDTNKTEIQSNDGIGQRIGQVGERFVEIKNDVARQLGTRVDSLGGLIKDHPFAAAGIGLGIGYLIARLLHR
jgi:ElaB/YqjD/DUF883 family membrane-anchored ribosome-binding protein